MYCVSQKFKSIKRDLKEYVSCLKEEHGTMCIAVDSAKYELYREEPYSSTTSYYLDDLPEYKYL
jgi:hypothetical protein